MLLTTGYAFRQKGFFPTFDFEINPDVVHLKNGFKSIVSIYAESSTSIPNMQVISGLNYETKKSLFLEETGIEWK